MRRLTTRVAVLAVFAWWPGVWAWAWELVGLGQLVPWVRVVLALLLLAVFVRLLRRPVGGGSQHGSGGQVRRGAGV